MYGLDVDDEQVMRRRTWRWLQARLEGLLTTPPIGQAHIPLDEGRERLVPLWRTRIQTHLLGEEA